MQPVIEIQRISKKFRISHEFHDPYLSLRETIANVFKKKTKTEEFWALKDISFDVYPGESIGIIGKNGAGKSTLLKILSKITPPTKGKIISRGRIASLLEVGTGFHPELSGRENIYLNGSILGMTRNEIKLNFDSIVDFSGVEKFLDTPLKHFSSGMQLRLAFAVAAYLKNDILIIDEVLSVGDAEFQRKCLRKMEDVSKNQGRTILFVSHQMGSLVQLCEKGILLENGQIIITDKINVVIDNYLNSKDVIKSSRFELAKNEIDLNKNQIIYFANKDNSGKEKSEFYHDEEIVIECILQLKKYNPNLEFAVSLYDNFKRRIFTIHEPLNKYVKADKAKFKIIIPANFITPGRYSWLMCINHPGIQHTDLKDGICDFQIIDNGSAFSKVEGLDYGCVFVNYKVIELI